MLARAAVRSTDELVLAPARVLDLVLRDLVVHDATGFQNFAASFWTQLLIRRLEDRLPLELVEPIPVGGSRRFNDATLSAGRVRTRPGSGHFP
jgi:hypothetical protein